MFNRMTLAASAVAVAAFVAGAASPAVAGHDDHKHKRGHGHHAHGHYHKHHAKHHHGRKHCKHAHVKHALHAMGFVSWDEIEWDDGKWEVDDARRADGSQYDLKLHPHTLKVVHSKRER